MSEPVKLHEWEQLPGKMARYAVPGGWLYQDRDEAGAPTVRVPDPTAEHCRQRVRWFRHENRPGFRTMDANGNVCVIREADKTCAEFATIAEAHDALGPDSPWVEVANAPE